MIRTLPSGATGYAPASAETYPPAHDLMKILMATARARGVEAVELANACLAYLAATMATGDITAETVARSLDDLVRINPGRSRRAAAVLAIAAELDANLSDDGIRALAAFTARCPDPGSWAALVETAAQLDGCCRGIVACPTCRARKLGAEIERRAAPRPDN